MRNIGAHIGDEKLEIVENNYMLGHGDRPIYHITYSPSSNGEFNYNQAEDVYTYVDLVEITMLIKPLFIWGILIILMSLSAQQYFMNILKRTSIMVRWGLFFKNHRN